MRDWRRWSWLLIAWTVGAVVLAIIALGALGDACTAMDGLGLTICRTGSAVGAIVVLIGIFEAWLIGFLLLAIGWFARRPAMRLCPPYGHPVEEGRSTCEVC